MLAASGMGWDGVGWVVSVFVFGFAVLKLIGRYSRELDGKVLFPSWVSPGIRLLSLHGS